MYASEIQTITMGKHVFRIQINTQNVLAGVLSLYKVEKTKSMKRLNNSINKENMEIKHLRFDKMKSQFASAELT